MCASKSGSRSLTQHRPIQSLASTNWYLRDLWRGTALDEAELPVTCSLPAGYSPPTHPQCTAYIPHLTCFPVTATAWAVYGTQVWNLGLTLYPLSSPPPHPKKLSCFFFVPLLLTWFLSFIHLCLILSLESILARSEYPIPRVKVPCLGTWLGMTKPEQSLLVADQVRQVEWSAYHVHHVGAFRLDKKDEKEKWE